MPHELYESMQKRDQRYEHLRAQRLSPRRSSVRNQQIHPMYVTDVAERMREEGTLETGFGNTQYQTFFSVLYEVRW